MTTTSKGPKADEQLRSLLDTVERLRRDQFPDLDPALVSTILHLHADGTAADGDLAREVEQAVERYLAEES